jgi:hemerythrin
MAVSLPEKLVTGIAGIDDQHRALIHWARTINTIDASNGGQATLRQASQFLIAYARFHFESEEHAMAAAGYQGIVQHRSEHQMLRRQLAKLNEAINGANYGSDITTICAMQRLIREWIQNHISASDLAFARYCERRPETRHIQLPSPQELQNSGVSIEDIEMVEAVHNAGEITSEELPKRLILKIRE